MSDEVHGRREFLGRMALEIAGSASESRPPDQRCRRDLLQIGPDGLRGFEHYPVERDKSPPHSARALSQYLRRRLARGVRSHLGESLGDFPHLFQIEFSAAESRKRLHPKEILLARQPELRQG